MNTPKYLLLALLILTSLLPGRGQQPVKIWEAPLTLPTYELKAPDKNPMFFRNQSYQGASRYIYPYALADNITGEKVDKTYKALYLENEYLKLCVLPEIGGRLFYATDKTNGYEIFYRQHVIKPANIGMVGAWISGGVEFCVFHHHRASTNLPVDYKLEQHEDGSATIWIGETEPRHRMKWTLGISLYPGKSYLEVDGRLINPTEKENSILYWANVATHVNDDYQIIFPPSTDFAVYHAKNSFAHWPVTTEVYNGREYYRDSLQADWWKNHPNPISMFAHDLQEGFLAGYDHGKDAGTMHVANHHIVKGAKLWEWGPGAYGAMWDSEVLTDKDGPYAELMTGAYSDNQPDYSWLKPYELKTFQQYWYPLRATGGAVTANLQATLNLKKLGPKEWLVAANTTQQMEKATIVLKKGASTLFEKEIDISPEKPFSQQITLAEVEEEALQLILEDATGETIISYQPQKKQENLPLPDPVEPPKAPEAIESLEELYLTGLRIRQFHNARINPEDYFQEALRRDSLDSRSNTVMGLIRKEDGELEAAAAHFRQALKRLTANYTRPRSGEALYHLGLTLLQQGRTEAAYDTLYRAAWDQAFAAPAYLHLARISVGWNDHARALEEVNRSLAYNSSNIPALNLKTVLLRQTGKQTMAEELAATVLHQDPLNFWAQRELALLTGDAGQQKDLKQMMRDKPEAYLELAVSYRNAGFTGEARDILLEAAHSGNDELSRYPTIHYYLGYLYHQAGDPEKAKEHWKTARGLPTDYCFPFRLETIAVYRAALDNDPTDAKANYYLGNLLYDKQPEQAIKYWEEAVRLAPGLAIAHRNLGWGYQQTAGDLQKAIAAYETAVQYDKTQARYYYELDKLYERQGAPIEKRLKLLTKNHQFVAQRPDAFLQEIQVLSLAGEYQQAIDYLLNNFFPRQEGVDNLHEIYVDACLGKGIAELEAGRYRNALKYFEMADAYPENHQIGRNDNYQKKVQIEYYQALTHEKLKKSKVAKTHYQAVAERVVSAPEFIFYKARALQQQQQFGPANVLAEQIAREGEELLVAQEAVDFFSKFGEGQSPQARQSDGHYLLGLAHTLKGDTKAAAEEFRSAIRLNPGHFWAGVYLD